MSKMPPCWSNRSDWKEWNRLNKLARDNPRKKLDNFCADCLPEFQNVQLIKGTCKYPTVMFVRIVERSLDPKTGRRRDMETYALKGER